MFAKIEKISIVDEKIRRWISIYLPELPASRLKAHPFLIYLEAGLVTG